MAGEDKIKSRVALQARYKGAHKLSYDDKLLLGEWVGERMDMEDVQCFLDPSDFDVLCRLEMPELTGRVNVIRALRALEGAVVEKQQLLTEAEEKRGEIRNILRQHCASSKKSETSTREKILTIAIEIARVLDGSDYQWNADKESVPSDS